ncbi:hypothetical protein Taro_011385, partial [Colocasia esculenta]|nr:hypothetical protein [Colocasia esculenta]
ATFSTIKGRELPGSLTGIGVITPPVMRVRQGASSGTICPTLRTLASTPTPIKAQVQYHATVFVLTSNRLPSLIPVEAHFYRACKLECWDNVELKIMQLQTQLALDIGREHLLRLKSQDKKVVGRYLEARKTHIQSFLPRFLQASFPPPTPSMAFPLLPLLLLVPVTVAFLLILALSVIIFPHPVKVPIKGRHVFVTGGSSGIGLAMARQAAAEGARVSILARDQSKLEAAREEIRIATGADVAVYSADVRDEAAVRKAVEAAGTIDVLVCNQGVFMARPLIEQDMAEARAQIETNLIGTLHLVKAALPSMKKAAAEDGAPRSIAFTASEAAQTGDGLTAVVVQVGIYGYAAYCASNFGIRGLAEALQMELISDNIHLSLILPADTETPGRAAEVGTRPEISNLIASTSGMLKPEEVAKKALKGIKAGQFTINVTLHGIILSLGNAGASPQSSPFMAFAEVVFAGLMRFVTLCYLASWYKIIVNYHAKVKSKFRT